MWPFKKPKPRNFARDASNELKRQIISGTYDPSRMLTRFMCLELTEARHNGTIDSDLERWLRRYIKSNLRKGYGALYDQIRFTTPEEDRIWTDCDRFGLYISMYNWYWKLIRKLDRVAQLHDTRYP